MKLHDAEPALRAGAELAEASTALIALHGRGADARGMLEFAMSELVGGEAAAVALVVPQARHSTWYPNSFLAPFAENQPWLDSALARVGDLVEELESAGLPAARIVLFGFSQGACLASEFVARSPRRYGGLIAATGGRIGPPGTRFDGIGELAGTPIHLSAGDPDPHVPWQRVEESAASFRAMGGEVVLRRAAGFPHTVHPDAVAFAGAILSQLANTPHA